ncbi:MAG TPA: hypothetical protein VN951_03255 [Pyrinomonadaceae bacterium]|nr:hypothetical protein [Pyrinomonadaceae bacterium]
MKPVIITLIFLLFASVTTAQRTAPPSKAELGQVTERGRQLAEYDVAAWYASDAVVATKPTEGSVARYIAKKDGATWAVMFGRLNDKRDKFLIAYEATQSANPKEFTVRKNNPSKEDTGFFLSAAKAIETCLADFKGAARPYNVAVLPASSNQIYVYAVPAQTKEGVFPLGSDARYLVSPDGSKILEKRQLHISIIEFSPAANENVEAGFHIAVLDDIPEDSDVFHVLSRRPSVPEYVGTKQFVFRIETDGTINYLMTMEAFKKMKGN